MIPALSRLNALWEAMPSEERKNGKYGVARKFYPIYSAQLEDDCEHLVEYLSTLKADIKTGHPDDAVEDPITGTLYFVGRAMVPLETDVVAKVFLKYCLNGKEYWWSNIRGPRGKMFDRLFRDYFADETAKESR